jgi:DNA-binding CsgD family transcriptional regulator
MSKKCVQINNEYILDFHQGGAHLVRPDSRAGKASSSAPTIKDLMDLSTDLCIKGLNGAAILMNDSAIERSGRQSLADCVGKTIYDVAKAETAEFISEHTNRTIRNKALTMAEYEFIRHDESIYNCLLFSLPWYQKGIAINGILSFAIVTDRNMITDSLASLMQLGILNKTSKLPAQSSRVYVSKRESECLKNLAQGKTSKEIAKLLGLSPRTVDHYFENCMNKFNVTSRYELIARYLSSIA